MALGVDEEGWGCDVMRMDTAAVADAFGRGTDFPQGYPNSNNISASTPPQQRVEEKKIKFSCEKAIINSNT